MKIKKALRQMAECFFGASSGIRFSAEKPRRLQQSTGLLLRAAFRLPD